MEAAERILAVLDAEDSDADLEPSLAGFGGFPGSGDDREADHLGGLNAGVSDDEPWLGSLGGTATSRGSQRGWAGCAAFDLEDEHDGREPQSEDEGAQCDDEGSNAPEAVPAYPNIHDQRTAWPNLDGVDGYDDHEEDRAGQSPRCEVGMFGGGL